VLVLFTLGLLQFSNGKQVHQTFCSPAISTFLTTLLLLASYFESPNGDPFPCHIPWHTSFWRLSRPHPWRLWNILSFLSPPPPKLNDDISSVAWDAFVSMAVDSVKLLPLPQPHLRTRTYAETYPSAQRATQLRSVLAHV
jgi:hypothetical protein